MKSVVIFAGDWFAFLPRFGGASVSSDDRGTGCSDGFVIFFITSTKMLEWHLSTIRDELRSLKSCHLTDQEVTKSEFFLTTLKYSFIVEL